MRILILTQYFPPEMGAPQARLFELGKRLLDMGHNVQVLTAMPNYPTGKVFQDYRSRLRVVEEIEGIQVTRTWIYPSKSTKILPRLVCYFSFVISSVLLGIWGLGRQDIVLFESPPLFLVPTGILIGRLTRARTVMNVSDIWPDIIVRMGYGTSAPLLKAMYWLEKFGYEHSDVVALTNPGAAAQVKARFSNLDVTVISNGVDTEFFRPDARSVETRKSLGIEDNNFCIGYCGLHGMAQGLEVVVAVAEQLKEHADIRFVMIGDGPVKDKLVQMAVEKHLHNLAFFDHRPKHEMPSILASCDASLVPLSVRLPGTMPSKIYEALASGSPPIVAKGCEGERLVNSFNAGRTYEPMDAQELAAVILDMANNPVETDRLRRNGISLARRFSRDVITKQTEAILRAIVEDQPLPVVEW